MEIGIAELAVGAAAVWRVTHLLHAEDGPWDAFAHLRKLAGEGGLSKMFDCFYCLSVWVAAPFAAAIGVGWKARVLLWPALSGAAILLERATARVRQSAPVAEWYEEPEAVFEMEDK
ncbi:MAG TPA: hypothetical protein VIY49_24800 [Bryobacteraceae bacterium]